MSVQARDGAWVSAIRVVKVDCSVCGHVLTTQWPQTDREIDDLLRTHALEQHAHLATEGE